MAVVMNLITLAAAAPALVAVAVVMATVVARSALAFTPMVAMMSAVFAHCFHLPSLLSN
jgi:hypothetical protein